MTKYIIILFIFFGVTLQAQEEKQDKITWYSIEEAQKIQVENPDKSMFIDIYTEWCGWCKKMDISTFKDEEVVSFLNEYFIPVKLDAEQKEDINFKNNTFKFRKSGNRGVHELAIFLLQGQMSYPSFLVLNSKNEAYILKGYLKPNELLNQL